jgi:DNA primase
MVTVYTSESGATSVFEILRGEIAIERLIETNRQRKALCISHSEKNLSMHVYEDHVHCYGCGFHGDVVDVWAAQKGIDRPFEAALDLGREFGVSLPEMNAESRQKAEERRREEDAQHAKAKGYHESLGDDARASDWWRGRGFDGELQQRFLLGTRAGAATIPFWTRGSRVAGVISRRYKGEPKYVLPNADKFPDGYRPLFIPAPLEGEIFLVEGYIDALVVAASGKSAIAVGGTDISEAQSAELRKIISSGAKIYILPDADESGAQAARAWGRKFFPHARVCPAYYVDGAKDIADTFADAGTEKTRDLLDRLATTSQDMIDLEIEVAKEIQGGPREKLAYANEHIVPLLAKIEGEAIRDATADIVAEQIKGLKKSWLNKGIKEANARLFSERIEAMAAEQDAQAERLQEEYRKKVQDARGEIDALLAPGVLGRLRDTAAAMHNVRRDEKALELALLVALGAQLAPLPNGRPLGASILITAQAGRGKNHIVDAAVKPLPPEFYFAFEIASGQSLYYKADEDPDFLHHTFAYPNEIEGAEQLSEFLRPMLSKGRAHKIVTAKDSDGNMTTRQITVEGPVTIAIPTIRNKTDEQLQTRLLVAELADYPGRVKEHSAAVSEQLRPDATMVDYSRQQFLWREGLRELTSIRRVVFPLKHEGFALDDDEISHGARLWTNLLSLMATNAWLEQKNHRILQLKDDVLAVEANPDDYEIAYNVFTKVCKRTVVNLSDTHRKILNGLYDLMENNPNRYGFRQREIAQSAGVALSTVSDNKTFLVMSAKLMKESDDGLALIEGADPSWWATGDMMRGLPTPAQVRTWWEERDPDPSESAEHAEHAERAAEQGPDPYTYGNSGVRHRPEHQPNTDQEVPNTNGTFGDGAEHVRRAFSSSPNAESGVGMENGADEDGVFAMFGGFEGDEDVPFLEDEEEL